MFEEETRGAVGGRLYPWQRGPLAESGRGGGMPMTGTPSLAENSDRALAAFSQRRVLAPYRGFHHRLQPAGMPRLLHLGTFGSPSPEHSLLLGQFRPLGCCRSPLQSSATFAIPFCARPDSGEDDISRSSVPPSLHGARSLARHVAFARVAPAAECATRPRISSIASFRPFPCASGCSRFRSTSAPAPRTTRSSSPRSSVRSPAQKFSRCDPSKWAKPLFVTLPPLVSLEATVASTKDVGAPVDRYRSPLACQLVNGSARLAGGAPSVTTRLPCEGGCRMSRCLAQETLEFIWASLERDVFLAREVRSPVEIIDRVPRSII